MADIIITIPASVSWKQYGEEMRRAHNGEHINFQVKHFPRKAKIGDRCYVCFRGFLIGWHKIVAFAEKQFTCTTTGKEWGEGKFIVRTGPMHHIDCRLMKGFQGFRYVKEQYV